jgi:hypothetical protein
MTNPMQLNRIVSAQRRNRGAGANEIHSLLELAPGMPDLGHG